MQRSAPALMLGALLLSTVSASATLIDFQDQPAGPSAFGVIAAQTLTYTFGSLSATFNGGAILTNEQLQTTDFSNAYATISFANGGNGTLSNPLTISFNQPVQTFFS